MFDWIVDAVQNLVVNYGAWGVFLGCLFEEIVSIIPSSVIILFAGFFILGEAPISGSTLTTLVTHIAIPVSIGLTIGSFFLYGIVHHLGEPFIRRWGKFMGVYWSDIEKIQRHMEKGKTDTIIFFITRSVAIVPFVAINAFCGLVRWPLKSYFFITLLGSFIRGITVGFIGWQLGRLYQYNARIFEHAQTVVLLIIIAFVLGFIYYRKKHPAQ